MRQSWPIEHDEMLKDCMQTMSFSKVAAQINAKFGTSYSRNATIGRAARMGLQKPKRRRKPRAPRPASVPRLRIIPQFKLDTTGLRCVVGGSLNIPLTDLESDQCRWPYGEGPFLFCGHVRDGESSYCAAHLALSMRVAS